MDNGIRDLHEEAVYPVRIRQNALHCSILEFCRHTISSRRPGRTGARPSPRESFRFLEREGRKSLRIHPTRSQQVATLPCKDPTRGPERNVPAPPSARGAEKKTRRNLKPVEFRFGTFRREIFIKEHVHVGTVPKFREGRASARPCSYQSSHLSTHLRRGARFSPLYSRLGSFGMGLKKLYSKHIIGPTKNAPYIFA